MSDSSGEGLRRAMQEAAALREQPPSGHEDAFEALTFSLSGEWYAFPLGDLVEIVGGAEPTPIPFTPPFVAGVMNHRGAIVPVVDLRKVFGLPVHFRREAGRVVLVRSGDSVVAFQADSISDIVEISRRALEPPLSTMEKASGAVRRKR